MAVLGIFVATAATTTGQDQRREMETLQKDKGWFYWENELAQARLRHDKPDKISRLEDLAKEYRERPFSPFVQPGKHFSSWDGNRYEEIVVDGYVYHTPHDTEEVIKARDIQRPGWPEKRTKDVVWYPLYPILAWSVMKLTGVSAAAALTIVSESCIVLAAVVMFLYARRHYYNRMPKLIIGGIPEPRAADLDEIHNQKSLDGLPAPAQPVAPAELHPSRRWDLRPEDSAALWAVGALLFSPCAVFLYANFTESLFVFLLVSFLYCLQGRWWWRAALIAAVAASCRSQGVLLGPVLALTFFLRSDIRNTGAKFGMAAALGVVSAIGLLCYMTYFQITFGDPLAFVHAQKYWNVGINAGSIYHALNPVNAMTHLMYYAFFNTPVDWPRMWEAFCIVWPPLMLLILGGRFLSFELEAVGWLMWGLPFVSNSLAGIPEGTWAWMSMGRFMAVMIPAYIIIGAVLVRFRWLGVPYLAASAAGFGIFAYKFGLGEWVG